MSEELDLSILKKLENLKLIAKKIRISGNMGERKSPKVGRGTEFADYRDYNLGDELRYIDWNIYARTEKFLIKLFEEEEDLDIHILLDTSSSMEIGSPSKLFYGKNLALAFAYLGLNSWERIKFCSFNEDLQHFLSLERRKENIFQLFRVLKDIKPKGKTNINKALKTYLDWQKRRGILIIISDFLSPNGFKEGLSLAKFRKFSVYIIQPLAEEEISPFYKGDLLLTDIETGEKWEVFIDDNIRKKYEEEFHRFLDDIERFTQSYNIEYLRTVTYIPIEDLLLRYLRVSGWLT
ncbi:MAG: DUF58 domain-containing protein [Dictyoglomus sp. NZ13-RE01]|nr:MAG: DUF58 domain-containing protein [Dictyoglomus sp. NZ13-RE01]